MRAALALAAAALACAVLAGEGLLRIVLPGGPHGPMSSYEWLEADGWLAWRNQPGFRHEKFEIGPHGLVGEQPVRPGSVRVLCLGDSRTFGIWLGARGFRFDGAYPERLQRLADGPGSGASLTVWNAGTLGYSSAHGLRQWRLRLDDALEPDVVIAAFGFNDHAWAWNRALRVRAPTSRLAWLALRGLAHSRLLESSLYVWRHRLASQAPDAGPWLSPEEYERHLGLFVDEARRRGVRLLLLALPLRALALGENRPLLDQEPTPWLFYGGKDLADVHRVHGSYRERLFRVAAREAAPLLDAAPAFEAQRRAQPGPEAALFSPYDLVHLNDRGAELLAALVLERLEALGWLRAPERRERSR